VGFNWTFEGLKIFQYKKRKNLHIPCSLKSVIELKSFNFYDKEVKKSFFSTIKGATECTVDTSVI